MTLGTASAATDAATVTVCIPTSEKVGTSGNEQGAKSLIVPQIAVPSSTNCATQVNYDALAIAIAQQNNAIAAQSNFLTFATIVLAFFGIILGLSWGGLVMWQAKIEAKKSAEQTAEAEVKSWMDTNAFPQISKLVKEIVPNNIDDEIQNPSPRTMTQAEQEVQLGNDPA